MPSWRILEGDVREQLAALPDASIHCVMTSPPYWGLRDYGTGTWEGGDPDCDHARPTNFNENFNERWGQGAGDRKQEARGQRPYLELCGKCGAERADHQVGLEETPEAYVAALVEVFREVRRVLRDDGTCWLNLGDSYASSPRGNAPGDWSSSGLHGTQTSEKYRDTLSKGTAQKRRSTIVGGLKPKDLVGIPWRVAFALQADGWYLRSDIIWAKPNPMPESVTDRPTRSHEYVFLLTKSSRYFYDADAIREPSAEMSRPQTAKRRLARMNRTIGKVAGGGQSSKSDEGAHVARSNPEGRNRRSVWTISTKPFPGAHFAVFPPELVEPCVKAGTSDHGCCANCGAPHRRMVEKARAPDPKAGKDAMRGAGHFRERAGGPANREGREFEVVTDARTVGWESTCECGADAVPCTVLDPFAGSGTTLIVANRLGRDGVGVELNPDYAAMARRRLGGDMPLFSVEAE